MIAYIDKNDGNISKIYPNCIKNRFDLTGAENYDLLRYSDKDINITIMVKYVNTTAYWGLYLVPISEKALKKIVGFVFRHNKSIKLIIFEYGYRKLGKDAKQVNHFRIHLPETPDLLQARLSKKGRYNIAREKRILEQEFGVWSIQKYSADSDEAKLIWEKYFEYKSITHGDYWKNVTQYEYCKKYAVSTVYALTLGEKQTIAAVILSCEQCPVVYIDNLTYDPSLSKYSLGQILYDEYLKTLIAQKRKELFLLGGNYSYKKRYGSEEEQLYNCRIVRHPKLIKIKVFIWELLVKSRILKA